MLGRVARSATREVIHSFERGVTGPRRVAFSRLAAEGRSHAAPATLAKGLPRRAPSAAAPATRGLLPEDGALRAKAYHMAHDVRDAASLAYIDQMARIGRVEGFSVVAMVPGRGHARELRAAVEPSTRRNLHPVVVPGAGDVWVEDSFELAARGRMHVPRTVGDGGQAVMKAILEGRRRRGVAPNAMPLQGVVDMYRTWESKVGLGRVGGYRVRRMTTYLEGGNVLPGRLADGTPYAIVGRDSLELNRSLLGKEGRLASARATREAMARDLDVAPTHLFVIEQPGDFHVDMAILPLEGKRVVLDDAREAARMQEAWWRADHRAAKPRGGDRQAMAAWREAGVALAADVAALHAHVRRVAPLQEAARRDLEGHGFTVLRMAGVFHDPRLVIGSVPSYGRSGRVGAMNFLNGEQALGRRGKYLITQGGDPRAEAYAARKLLQELPTGLARLHFLDRRRTPQTLAAAGGINCRAKPEGVVVPHQARTGPGR